MPAATISIAQRRSSAHSRSGRHRTRTPVHRRAWLDLSGRCHGSVSNASIELRARDERSRRREHERCRSTGVLRARATGERISCRQDACEAEKSGRSAGAALSRLPATSRNPSLPDPCVRQCGTRAKRPFGGKGLLSHCAIRAACIAYAVAYIHATWPMGGLNRLQSCGKASGAPSRATRVKNCTPWIIWCMPTCKVDATTTRRKSFSNSRTCQTWIWRLQDRVRLHRNAGSLRR